MCYMCARVLLRALLSGELPVSSQVYNLVDNDGLSLVLPSPADLSFLPLTLPQELLNLVQCLLGYQYLISLSQLLVQHLRGQPCVDSCLRAPHGACQRIRSQVVLVSGWSFPQFLLHLCPAIFCFIQDQLQVENLKVIWMMGTIAQVVTLCDSELSVLSAPPSGPRCPN